MQLNLRAKNVLLICGSIMLVFILGFSILSNSVYRRAYAESLRLAESNAEKVSNFINIAATVNMMMSESLSNSIEAAIKTFEPALRDKFVETRIGIEATDMAGAFDFLFIILEAGVLDGSHTGSWFVDNSGRFFKGVDGNGRINNNGLDGNFGLYQQVRQSNRIELIDPFIFNNELYVAMAVPIHDEQENFAGVVAAGIKMTTLQQALITVQNTMQIDDAYGFIVTSGFISIPGLRGAEPTAIRNLFEADIVRRIEQNLVRGEDMSAQFYNSRTDERSLLVLVPFLPFGIEVGDGWMAGYVLPMRVVTASAYNIITVLVLIGVIIIIVSSLLVMSTISRIVKVIITNKDYLDNLAAGDMTFKIDNKLLQRSDEIGVMTRSVAAVESRLAQVVGDTNKIVAIIEHTATEIHSASGIISTSSSEQAASTEEASASVETMSSAITQSVNNVSHTEKIAKEAANKATQGGITVNQTSEAMKIIAEKITMIEGIAKQTNLLALNAAIEAARAGDNGRGFAVVAGEVRKLAEHTAFSAAEISELSKNGLTLAQSAGELINAIVPQIQQTAQLIREVAVAGKEQRNSIEQFDKMMQLDIETTQRNASSSEELSASAELLKEQAKKLKGMMAFFKVSAEEVRLEYKS
ncbi:MAG: methyl-accepting chemotaxis protein [Spirochaetaceae bacterium]|nr:methyl-accepting chemotaxis protein [Spirochaetaceae bacterium]